MADFQGNGDRSVVLLAFIGAFHLKGERQLVVPWLRRSFDQHCQFEQLADGYSVHNAFSNHENLGALWTWNDSDIVAMIPVEVAGVDDHYMFQQLFLARDSEDGCSIFRFGHLIREYLGLGHWQLLRQETGTMS